MPTDDLTQDTTFNTREDTTAGNHVLYLSGTWTVQYAAKLEEHVSALQEKLNRRQADYTLDLSGIDRLDTAGAVLVARLKKGLSQHNQTARISGEREEMQQLLSSVQSCQEAPKARQKERSYYTLIADLGASIVGMRHDFTAGLSYLGSTTLALGRVIANPSRFRMTSFVFHLEQVALRAVPIVMLISFLVGAIVAQQSIFQLRTFGATVFVVDLVAILSLRELGVLLASIMVAGRSGSAFTAEIGSMKMREEIDALRVMALDPIEVLVLPRLLALVVGLPLLTFLAEMASLAGGASVAWIYGGISLDVFLNRLQDSITWQSMAVGLIKAPFMGLVVALIATIEGLQVQGSAESLGRRTTASVVKSIFTVILLDGLFAMLFAAIGW